MALFILGMCRPLWGIPSVQLFLPLEGLVSLTTVSTLLSYAFTVNKAVKWDMVEKKVGEKVIEKKVEKVIEKEDVEEKDKAVETNNTTEALH